VTENAEVVDIETIDDITEDERNTNKGTERGGFALRESMVRFGPGRSALIDRAGKIIAGEKTIRTEKELGIPIRVVKTSGDELVIVQREDLDHEADGGQARGLAIADNRVAELNLAYDANEIIAQVDEGVDISAFFYDRELEQLAGRQLMEDLEDDGADLPADDLTFDPVPEMAIQPFEHWDYVVFFFRNTWDWAMVIDALGLEKQGFSITGGKGKLRRKIGLCRALDGAKLMELLNANRNPKS